MNNVFCAGDKGGKVGDMTLIPTAKLDNLRERIVAATEAMTVAVEHFTGMFAAIDDIDELTVPGTGGEVTCGVDCACSAGECLFDSMEAVVMTPELESCLGECMMGDAECVSACVEQAKLAAG